MTIKMKLSGLLLGILLATTSVFAGESCGAGKCGAAMMKDSKVACDMNPNKSIVQFLLFTCKKISIFSE